MGFFYWGEANNPARARSQRAAAPGRSGQASQTRPPGRAGVNRELARLVERRETRRVAVCAHEIGHAVGAIAGGQQPEYVQLKTGILGGTSGGTCMFRPVDPHGPMAPKLGYLVALMAGHAAEVRFCRLYLGMDARRAYRYGRDWAEGDYDNYSYYRSRWGVGWSHTRDWGFAQAERIVADHGDYLDRMTVRLDRAGRIDGRDL